MGEYIRQEGAGRPFVYIPAGYLLTDRGCRSAWQHDVQNHLTVVPGRKHCGTNNFVHGFLQKSDSLSGRSVAISKSSGRTPNPRPSGSRTKGGKCAICDIDDAPGSR